MLLNGENKGVVYELSENGQYLIGRDPSCNICLNDQVASKRHARITLENGKLTVEDLSSHNGTFVNGRRFTFF